MGLRMGGWIRGKDVQTQQPDRETNASKEELGV